jgi:DNA-binding IclR family transcriptional regulator
MGNWPAPEPGGAVQSVDRALTILSVLARFGEAGVTEIAGELGVHKSTAFRLVATLEAHDLVEQTEDRGKYRLGMGLVRLAGAGTARLDVVREARPVCRRLAAECGETVNIAVLADRSALYVDQVSGGSGLRSHNWVGQRIPLHATSNGKVLLSELTRAEVDGLVERLRSYTERTITTRAVLHRELATVREQGYAVAVDELELGLTAISVPLRSAHGEVVASMSVSGPSLRMTEARVETLLPVLTEAAAAVSNRLGWLPAQPPGHVAP